MLEQEQILSIFERVPRIREDDPKLETKQNLLTRIERVGISHDVSDPRGAVVNACVRGTHVEVLLDTGATTDLIRTNADRRMVDAPTMERYVGRLETADRQLWRSTELSELVSSWATLPKKSKRLWSRN